MLRSSLNNLDLRIERRHHPASPEQDGSTRAPAAPSSRGTELNNTTQPRKPTDRSRTPR